MRKVWLSTAFCLLLTACGGRTLSKNHAQDLILRLPEQALQKEDVEVVYLRQVSGSEAIAETRLNAAFRLEKTGGDWIVREVRLGHGQWEKVSNLLQTLEAVKTAETCQMLERIVEAIRKYREANGSLPAFDDYVSLSDLLSPKFLIPLIRLDSWRNALAAEHRDSTSILIRSAGPDAKHGTKDDIVRNFPP
jgi:hypothetical protein